MTSNNTPPRPAGLGIWGNLGIWIALGLSFGVVVGVLFDNIALGAAFGPIVGVVAWAVFIETRRNARGGS